MTSNNEKKLLEITVTFHSRNASRPVMIRAPEMLMIIGIRTQRMPLKMMAKIIVINPITAKLNTIKSLLM